MSKKICLLGIHEFLSLVKLAVLLFVVHLKQQRFIWCLAQLLWDLLLQSESCLIILYLICVYTVWEGREQRGTQQSSAVIPRIFEVQNQPSQPQQICPGFHEVSISLTHDLSTSKRQFQPVFYQSIDVN